ncbi:hypothetical protein IAU60_006168 [Kwoniella sp. DSM 27419]
MPVKVDDHHWTNAQTVALLKRLQIGPEQERAQFFPPPGVRDDTPRCRLEMALCCELLADTPWLQQMVKAGWVRKLPGGSYEPARYWTGQGNPIQSRMKWIERTALDIRRVLGRARWPNELVRGSSAYEQWMDMQDRRDNTWYFLYVNLKIEAEPDWLNPIPRRPLAQRISPTTLTSPIRSGPSTGSREGGTWLERRPRGDIKIPTGPRRWVQASSSLSLSTPLAGSAGQVPSLKQRMSQTARESIATSNPSPQSSPVPQPLCRPKTPPLPVASPASPADSHPVTSRSMMSTGDNDVDYNLGASHERPARRPPPTELDAQRAKRQKIGTPLRPATPPLIEAHPPAPDRHASADGVDSDSGSDIVFLSHARPHIPCTPPSTPPSTNPLSSRFMGVHTPPMTVPIAPRGMLRTPPVSVSVLDEAVNLARIRDLSGPFVSNGEDSSSEDSDTQIDSDEEECQRRPSMPPLPGLGIISPQFDASMFTDPSIRSHELDVLNRELGRIPDPFAYDMSIDVVVSTTEVDKTVVTPVHSPLIITDPTLPTEQDQGVSGGNHQAPGDQITPPSHSCSVRASQEFTKKPCDVVVDPTAEDDRSPHAESPSLGHASCSFIHSESIGEHTPPTIDRKEAEARWTDDSAAAQATSASSSRKGGALAPPDDLIAQNKSDSPTAHQSSNPLLSLINLQRLSQWFKRPDGESTTQPSTHDVSRSSAIPPASSSGPTFANSMSDGWKSSDEMDVENSHDSTSTEGFGSQIDPASVGLPRLNPTEKSQSAERSQRHKDPHKCQRNDSGNDSAIVIPSHALSLASTCVTPFDETISVATSLPLDRQVTPAPQSPGDRLELDSAHATPADVATPHPTAVSSSTKRPIGEIHNSTVRMAGGMIRMLLGEMRHHPSTCLNDTLVLLQLDVVPFRKALVELLELMGSLVVDTSAGTATTVTSPGIKRPRIYHVHDLVPMPDMPSRPSGQAGATKVTLMELMDELMQLRSKELELLGSTSTSRDTKLCEIVAGSDALG